ncbi:ribonucleotide-diphosphate reductase subunit beta [gut metagenome]|uniref:Ribonucleotide-diphosphate reductase subunit beta n=1 Tax=gut metagenome TaxID=749906 RepID=J9GA56_9ZZZZ
MKAVLPKGSPFPATFRLLFNCSSFSCSLLNNNFMISKDTVCCKPLTKNALFNPSGDTDLRLRRLIGGNSTNLNDFNNLRYAWVSDWYRQAMNNFWIPEEINLTQDAKDYRLLSVAERTAYDKILSFLVFLDSLQSNNLPSISEYLTANEAKLCLHIQAFQECVHSQSYSYMLDTICSPEERNDILYQWKTDAHLLRRNSFIGQCYNDFQENQNGFTLAKTLIANYILEGIYFYSGFMFFYNLSRNGKMSGSAQEIRYINRDENTHLWLFRNLILELKKEEPDLFCAEWLQVYEDMMREGIAQEIAWGQYVIGDNIPGLTGQMVEDYIRYLGNLRWQSLGFGHLFEGYEKEPESMAWVGQYANANRIKTDFFEARSTAYAKSTVLVDDL